MEVNLKLRPQHERTLRCHLGATLALMISCLFFAAILLLQQNEDGGAGGFFHQLCHLGSILVREREMGMVMHLTMTISMVMISDMTTFFDNTKHKDSTFKTFTSSHKVANPSTHDILSNAKTDAHPICENLHSSNSPIINQ